MKRPSFDGADVAHIIAAGAARDIDEVAQRVADIAEADGVRGLFAFTCGVATAVVKLGHLEPADDEFVGIEADHDTSIDDSAELWAARMIAAIANKDVEQALAVFEAKRNQATNPHNPEELVSGIVALIAVAAALVRNRPAGAS